MNLLIDRQKREVMTQREIPELLSRDEAPAPDRPVAVAGRPPLELLDRQLRDGQRIRWILEE